MKLIERFTVWLLKPVVVGCVFVALFFPWLLFWSFSTYSPYWNILPIFFIAFYLPLYSSRLLKKFGIAKSGIALIASLWIIFIAYSQFNFSYVTNYFEWTRNNKHYFSFQTIYSSLDSVSYQKQYKPLIFNTDTLPKNGFIGLLYGADMHNLKSQIKGNIKPKEEFLNRALYNSNIMLAPLKKITIILTSISTLLFLNSWALLENNKKKEEENRQWLEKTRIREQQEYDERVRKEAEEKAIREAKAKREREETQKELEIKRKAEAERKEQERITKRRSEYDGLPDVIKKNTPFEDFLGE